MSDKYDEEIDRLVKADGIDVFNAWTNCCALFRYCTPNGNADCRDDGEECGCLTMVRSLSSMGAFAWTQELTIAIRADETIPENIRTISSAWRVMDEPARRAALEPFARWQRRLDREIRSAR